MNCREEAGPLSKPKHFIDSISQKNIGIFIPVA